MPPLEISDQTHRQARGGGAGREPLPKLWTSEYSALEIGHDKHKLITIHKAEGI